MRVEKIQREWELLKTYPVSFNVVEFAGKYMDKLFTVALAAKRADEICELVNMGDEPMKAIGESQEALTKAIEELET